MKPNTTNNSATDSLDGFIMTKQQRSAIEQLISNRRPQAYSLDDYEAGQVRFTITKPTWEQYNVSRAGKVTELN